MIPDYIRTIIDSTIARRYVKKENEVWERDEDFLFDVAWQVNDILKRKRQNPAEPVYEMDFIIDGKNLFDHSTI